MIHARIQAHPDRSHLHHDLVEATGFPTEVMVHKSDPPNPWHGYRQCLTDIPPCDHLLVIQDDAVPCKNFAQAMEQVGAANPDTPVSLWLSSQPAGTAARARQAMMRNKRYVWFGYTQYVYLVAMLWPRRLAVEFLEWTENNKFAPTGREARADDGVVARWAHATKQAIICTVPSLVEHPDVEPSVKGGAQKAMAGQDRARVALFLAEDGLAYQW